MFQEKCEENYQWDSTICQKTKETNVSQNKLCPLKHIYSTI